MIIVVLVFWTTLKTRKANRGCSSTSLNIGEPQSTTWRRWNRVWQETWNSSSRSYRHFRIAFILTTFYQTTTSRNCWRTTLGVTPGRMPQLVFVRHAARTGINGNCYPNGNSLRRRSWESNHFVFAVTGGRWGGSIFVMLGVTYLSHCLCGLLHLNCAANSATFFHPKHVH